MSIEIERTKGDNGKYLSYFDDPDEALEFIEEQIRRYKFTPNKNTMSAARLCREAQRKGIHLHPTTFRKWLNDRDIELYDSRPKKSHKQRKHFTISNIVVDELENYDQYQSYLADLGLRLVLGIPTEDAIIHFPHGKNEVRTSAIFKFEKNGAASVLVSGEVDAKFKQQLRYLATRAELQGREAIKDYARQNGYTYYGTDETISQPIEIDL